MIIPERFGLLLEKQVCGICKVQEVESRSGKPDWKEDQVPKI